MKLDVTMQNIPLLIFSRLLKMPGVCKCTAKRGEKTSVNPLIDDFTNEHVLHRSLRYDDIAEDITAISACMN